MSEPSAEKDAGLPSAWDVAADHGHFAETGFPDAETGASHLVCACGLPWTPGEGCVFMQGVTAGLTSVTSPAETDTPSEPSRLTAAVVSGARGRMGR